MAASLCLISVAWLIGSMMWANKSRLLSLTSIALRRKNLYRQNFCQAELGYNKAQALAVRYKAMFPKLKIGAIEDPASAIRLDRSMPTVVIGCVDNAVARKSIEELMIEYSSLMAHGFSQTPCWWIDCGNDYTYGQVSIGNWYSVELDDYILEPATCIILPLPTHPISRTIATDRRE